MVSGDKNTLLVPPDDRRTIRFRVPLQDKKRSTGKSPPDAVESRKRVIRLVVVIVLSFAILSCPRYIYMMWNAYRETNGLHHVVNRRRGTRGVDGGENHP